MNLTIQSMSGNTPIGMESATVTVKNRKDSTARMQSIGRSSSTTKRALNYNSREISSQLMRASKSRNAATVLAKAKSKVAMLQRCKASDQYHDTEVEIALAHAKRMVKCAQLKVSNLKQEEVLKKSSERELASSKQQKKNEVKRLVAQKENEMRQKAATEELQQSLKEKEYRRELVQKRRMHRNQERSKIAEADIKYLQDQTNRSQGSGVSDTGVSLDISSVAMNMNELKMMETQIDTEEEMEIGVIDASVGVDGSCTVSNQTGTTINLGI